MIGKAVVKPAFKHILSTKFNVKVLPTRAAHHNHAFPDEESTQDLNDRVKLYLAGIARQGSAATQWSIKQFLARIQQGSTEAKNDQNKVASDAQGAAHQLSLLQDIHCECTLLRHHLEVPTPAPHSYFGVSKPPCFQCSLYFQACKILQLGAPYETRGSQTEVVACELPSGTSGRDKMDERIEEEMGSLLDDILGKLISAQNTKYITTSDEDSDSDIFSL
jgi:hypothetical protein